MILGKAILRSLLKQIEMRKEEVISRKSKSNISKEACWSKLKIGMINDIDKRISNNNLSTLHIILIYDPD